MGAEVPNSMNSVENLPEQKGSELEIKKYEENAIFKGAHKTERNMTPCGGGSSEKSTRHIIKFISDMIAKYDLKSISDVGCGDFSWFNRVELGGVEYTGYDINEIMLKQVRKNYPAFSFLKCDASDYEFPKTDLIICRDCLFHLHIDIANRALSNFIASGSLYLMAPTFTWTNSNSIAESDTKGGYSARRYNMGIGPFNLGNPIEFIEEPTKKKRTFGMWKLNYDSIGDFQL